MILAVVQTKGGVGKTTLAVNLAIERARGGSDVLLVDADEQRTAADFSALRAERLGGTGYTVIELSGANVRTQVARLSSKYDDTVIDVGGRDSASLRAALTVADTALVPFQPRTFDIWTIDVMSRLVDEARAFNPALRAVAVLNACDPQGEDNRLAAEALRGAAAIQFLDAAIGRRKTFANAAAGGLGIGEASPRDRKACAELTLLIDKIFQRR